MKIYVITPFLKVLHADGKPTSEKDDILVPQEIEVDDTFVDNFIPANELKLPQAYIHKDDDRHMAIYRYDKLYILDKDYLETVQEQHRVFSLFFISPIA